MKREARLFLLFLSYFFILSVGASSLTCYANPEERMREVVRIDRDDNELVRLVEREFWSINREFGEIRHSSDVFSFMNDLSCKTLDMLVDLGKGRVVYRLLTKGFRLRCRVDVTNPFYELLRADDDHRAFVFFLGDDEDVDRNVLDSTLHYAIAKRNNKIVLKLLKLGADPNSEIRLYGTGAWFVPLGFALQQKNLYLVESLLFFNVIIHPEHDAFVRSSVERKELFGVLVRNRFRRREVIRRVQALTSEEVEARAAIEHEFDMYDFRRRSASWLVSRFFLKRAAPKELAAAFVRLGEVLESESTN